MIVGRIAEIWRHPVKSMEGERIAAGASSARRACPGDRAWAVRDERARRHPRREEDPGPDALQGALTRGAEATASAPAPEITLPDGSTLLAGRRRRRRARSARRSARPSRSGRSGPRATSITTGAARPTTPTSRPSCARSSAATPNEPLPNLGVFPPELFQYESPPGTYFDAFPLLLLTDASLRRLARARARLAHRRAPLPPEPADRDSPEEGFPEIAWEGRSSRRRRDARRHRRCPRCVMITHGFADLPRDPALMRTVVREANQNIGVYAARREARHGARRRRAAPRRLAARPGVARMAG